MSVISAQQLLSAPVVTRAISRIKTPLSRFQTAFGCLPGGPNVNPVGGHITGWDIFDKTRTIAKGRAPGLGPATVALKPIGHQTATIYRAHEKGMILDEQLFRTRPLGGKWGDVDTRGQRYVTAQEGFLAQRFKNNREFMLSRMLRGGFDLKFIGDDVLPVDLGNGDVTVDYKVPAGNKAKLDMLGAGDILGTSWANAAAPIIGDVCAINAAFEQLHGRPLRHVWCNNVIMQYLMTNTGLIAAGGTANTVFSQYAPSNAPSEEGIPDTGFEIVFRGIPWLTFHVYDGGLEVYNSSGVPTYTKFLDDTHAIFLPDIDSSWFEAHEGSEIVRENRMHQGDERFGLQAWTEIQTQPAGFELIGVDNWIPIPYVPSCIAYGTVVY